MDLKEVSMEAVLRPSLRKGMNPYLVETDNWSIKNLEIKGCKKGIQWLSD